MDTKSMSPEDCSDKVLTELRASNLHYIVQESPFSVYITIRKKFAKAAPKVLTNNSESKPIIPMSTLLEQIVNLESVNKSLKLAVEKQVCELSETKNVKLFEEKLEKAESEVLNQSKKFKEAKDELCDEIKLLKKAIKQSNDETKVQQKTLTELRKNIKQKEKENYNLSQNLENLQEKAKTLKDTNNNQKMEKNKLDKINRKLMEKVSKRADLNLTSKETQTIPNEITSDPTSSNLFCATLPSLLPSPNCNTSLNSKTTILKGMATTMNSQTTSLNSFPNSSQTATSSLSSCMAITTTSLPTTTASLHPSPSPYMNSNIVGMSSLTLSKNTPNTFINAMAVPNIAPITPSSETSSKLSLKPVPVISKAVRIDIQNFESAMKVFLETFKENSSDENVKYSVSAKTFMSKGYNYFHVSLKDVRKSNPNLAGFLSAEYKWENSSFMAIDRSLAQVARNFISDLGLGEPQNGLHFCLARK